ncbi:MAG: RNA polymerase sigma factor [Planctomycetes bacterium]|nr:RNA polymerase sigma factor [Planctomycetota bacterium]
MDVRDHITALAPRVLALARSLRGPTADAEDLAQDTLRTALESSSAFDEALGSPDAWLFGICRRLSRRRAASTIRLGLEDRAASESAPSDWRRDGYCLLDRAFLALPEDQRSAFSLVVMQGLGYRAAARIEEVTVGTLKSRVSRARRALRLVLSRYWEDSS